MLGDGAEPDSILAFGAGKQIEAHIDLHLREYPSIKRVSIVNRSRDRALALLDVLPPRHPNVQFDAIQTRDGGNVNKAQLRELVSNAAIIVAATSSTEPLFGDLEGSVRAGAHIILVGSYKPHMREVSSQLLWRTGAKLGSSTARVVVDSREACLHEAGELIQADLKPEALVELGELVTEKDGRLVVHTEKCQSVRAAGEVTIFKSVGVGVQDVSISEWVVRKAEEAGLGTVIPDYY
jgi:ornithine cyclodeaminase/alanine dehydrogenase-like protein (mu-crystallin family)